MASAISTDRVFMAATVEINIQKFGSHSNAIFAVKKLCANMADSVTLVEENRRIFLQGDWLQIWKAYSILSDTPESSHTNLAASGGDEDDYMQMYDHTPPLYRNCNKKCQNDYIYVNNFSQMAPVNDVMHAQRLKNKKIVIFFYEYDITDLQTDAVINSTNGLFKCSKDSLTEAILKKAGKDVSDECSKFIIGHSRLPETKIFSTKGGSLPCSHIIHTVPPLLRDYHDSKKCQARLQETVRNCLHEAVRLQIRYLAMPLIGRNRIPDNDIVMHALWKELQAFDSMPSCGATLREIHIVDTDKKSLKEMVKLCKMYATD